MNDDQQPSGPNDLPPLQPHTVASALKAARDEMVGGNIAGADYILEKLEREFILDDALLMWRSARASGHNVAH